MSNYKPRNPRIISIRQKARILHVEDALDVDRIRFELWDYARGNGASGHADAYLDRHTARALAAELATGRLMHCEALQDSGGGTVNGTVTARLLRIETADTDNPIRITITNGPGVKQQSGLISLQQGAAHTRIQILISRLDAKRIGLAMLHHIQAWEILTFRDRARAGTWTPATDSPNLCPDCHTRPCSCNLQRTVVDALAGTDEPPPADPDTGEIPDDDPVLRYGNGDPVSENENEIGAFQLYVKAEHALPPDVEALRQWVLDHSAQKEG